MQFPAHVDGASIRTLSDVKFRRPDLAGRFYSTTTQEQFPPKKLVPPVYPPTHILFEQVKGITVMAFQSIKLFALELDGPEDTVYSSGEMITGVVVLELNREIKVRALRVLGRGVATAHWLENRSVGVNTVYNDYTSKITYFRKRQHLIRE
ncbi:hypothetical protein Q8A67_021606 [Cirrhinus molitorella]|uniref:Arrestin-like N-terminal domain-containing protein n=1 Tax=Cirrhinus molitorella TaxID=172907 RepID=A0AA88TMY4_9TELE|nr:hypothetical protein Q8A67_021606 [Cirrhinus molitorella]